MEPDETKRLATQREHVFWAMSAQRWKTFYEIQKEIHWQFGCRHSEASISARLRDFRKVRYGGMIVNRRKRSGNLYEYQVLPAASLQAEQIGMFQEAVCVGDEISSDYFD